MPTEYATHRCYIEHGDGWACPHQATYVARLAWTAGPMMLCEEHARVERAHGDVLEIRRLRTGQRP